MNTISTITLSAALSHTSFCVRVRMEVEPNRVLHTSPDRFDDVENWFITI